MTWLTVAQISEFSFIIVWLALTAWTLEDPNILSLVTIIWLVTMTWSSYLFANAESIFDKISPYLAILETKNKRSDKDPQVHSDKYTMVVIWYWRLWKFMASKLKQYQIHFCVVDSEPVKFQAAEKAWYNTIYGDVSDNDLLSQLVWTQTQIVYSTVDDHETNIHILETVKNLNENIKVISLAAYLDEAEHLYDKWADYVVFPHMSWAHESRDILEKHVRKPEEFILHKIRNREALKTHKTHIYD